MAETIQTDAARQREVRKMGRTIGEAIFDEGQVNAIRNIILRLGTKRFGDPSLQVKQRLDAIMELEKLRNVSDKVIDVNSWDELFLPG